MSILQEDTVLSPRSLRIGRMARQRRARRWERLGRQIALGLEWLAYHSPYSMLSGEELYLYDEPLARSAAGDDRAPPDGTSPS
ncbi:MAG: hypothetical protein WEE64_01715 [Dehalococcoidia bacterium]